MATLRVSAAVGGRVSLAAPRRQGAVVAPYKRPVARPQTAMLPPAQLGALSFKAAFTGVAIQASAPLRRLIDAFRSLVVECNRKKGKGCTLEGTRRKRARVSGFRTRMETPGGRKVLAARRKKGRAVLVPASAPNHWNGMKR